MANLTPAQQAILDDATQRLANDPQQDDLYMLNPEDAGSFYQSSNGVWYLQQCPLGSIFDSTIPTCSPQVMVSVDVNPAPRPEILGGGGPTFSTPEAPKKGIIRPSARDVGY